MKLNLSDITIGERRRKYFHSVEQEHKKSQTLGTLANSIKENGLQLPIAVRKQEDGSYILVDGHRRLLAHQLLVEQGLTEYNEIEVHLPPAKTDLAIAELVANMERKDFTNTELLEAVVDLLARFDGRRDEVAKWLSVSPKFISNATYVHNAMVEENKQVEAGTLKHKERKASLDELERTSISAVYRALKTEEKRQSLIETQRGGPIPSTRTDVGETPETKDETKDESVAVLSKTKTPSPEKGEDPRSRVHLASFPEWVEDYKGPLFNFVHCDFPYGVGLNRGTMYKGAGSYDDTYEIFEYLSETLVKHRGKLLTNSAHILFWFSPKYIREIYELFPENKGFAIDPRWLTWFKSDKKGGQPNDMFFYKNIVEVAFHITYGKAALLGNTDNAIAHPRGGLLLHESEKPVPVLEHFFRPIVHDGTRMLDPTCGSGTALKAALRMGAEWVVGIDQNPKHTETALALAGRNSYETHHKWVHPMEDNTTDLDIT